MQICPRQNNEEAESLKKKQKKQKHNYFQPQNPLEWCFLLFTKGLLCPCCSLDSDEGQNPLLLHQNLFLLTQHLERMYKKKKFFLTCHSLISIG